MLAYAIGTVHAESSFNTQCSVARSGWVVNGLVAGTITWFLRKVVRHARAAKPDPRKSGPLDSDLPRLGAERIIWASTALFTLLVNNARQRYC